MRVSGVQSFGDPAATNLITNGGFESDTSGWATFGTNTIARSTDQAKSGAASLKCTYGNNTFLASYTITVAAGGAYSFGVWVYIPTAYDGTDPKVGFNSFTGGTNKKVSCDLGLRDQWQFVASANSTIAAGDLSGDVDLIETGTTPTAGRFIYIDNAQCELGAVSTPYIETDGGTDTRAASVPVNRRPVFSGSRR